MGGIQKSAKHFSGALGRSPVKMTALWQARFFNVSFRKVILREGIKGKGFYEMD